MTTIKSIEEKARRYDKALERANKLKETCDSNAVVGWMEYIFPELKESGDIRKRIIDALHGDVLEMGEIKKATTWLEKQGNLMKALQISNAKIGELIEKNYYLKEQLEKQGENNMGISEATKQKLEDNLNKALKKETPESCNEFLDEQGEQKTTIEMITPEESLGIDSDTYNKIVDECVYGEQKPAWGEEDIELLDNTIKFIEDRVAATSPSLRTYSPTLTGKEIPFLKALKDRYTWKPSEGQLECLGYAIEKAEKDWSPLTNNRVYLTLKALKEQLLELRGSKV